jgi:hypothetical protein
MNASSKQRFEMFGLTREVRGLEMVKTIVPSVPLAYGLEGHVEISTSNDLIREVILGVKFQRIVGAGIAETLAEMIKVFEYVGIINAGTAAELGVDVVQCRSSDITLGAKLFWKRIAIVDHNEECRQSTLVNALRSCVSIVKRKGDTPEIISYCQSFYSECREIAQLIGYLREVRNLLTHDTREREEAGALLAAVGAAIRFAELTRLPSDLYSNRREFAERTRAELIARFAPENTVDEPISKPKQEIEVMRELRILAQEVRALSDNLKEKPKANAEISTVLPQPAEVDGASELSEDLDSEMEQFHSLMNSEMLRQKLEALQERMRAFLGKRWGGPATSLMQGAVIDDILLHEAESCEDALALPDVVWRYEQHRDLFDLQVAEFGGEIDEALKSTGWSLNREMKHLTS